MAAYERALAAEEATAMSRQASPVYEAWPTHIAALIAQERPDLDAELLAHIVPGSLHTDPFLGNVARRVLWERPPEQ